MGRGAPGRKLKFKVNDIVQYELSGWIALVVSTAPYPYLGVNWIAGPPGARREHHKYDALALRSSLKIVAHAELG